MAMPATGHAWSPTAGGLEELLEPLTAQSGIADSAMGCCLLMVTGPSVAAKEEQGWDQPLSGCQGVPGAAGSACTKALHTSTSWGRAATAPAPEGRGEMEGQGAPTWHWLGLPAALFHLALGGMHGSIWLSPARTDSFLHPVSVLTAHCRKRKAKQALPSRLVQS